MDVDEFLYEATYQIIRAWTNLFDETLNQGWSDEEEN